MRQPARSASALYTRFNGMMLGFFLVAAHHEHPDLRCRYAWFRQRIHAFLREIGAPRRLPKKRAGFLAHYPELVALTLVDVEQRNRDLAENAWLALYATGYAVEDDRARAQEQRRLAHKRMKELALKRDLVDRFATGIERSPGSFDIGSLHTEALGFLDRCLRPLEPKAERRTAFVAMPFSTRFAPRYASFYRPLLARYGYDVAIRGWGGIVDEPHMDLLHTLLEKCGVVLADLSATRNTNVAWEVGYAQGIGKLTFLIRDAAEAVPAANLRHLWVFSYRRDGPGWQERAIDEAKSSFDLARASYARWRMAGGHRSDPADA